MNLCTGKNEKQIFIEIFPLYLHSISVSFIRKKKTKCNYPPLASLILTFQQLSNDEDKSGCRGRFMTAHIPALDKPEGLCRVGGGGEAAGGK